MLLNFTNTKSCPVCILCPKNAPFSAQPTNKRLSSSRNSIPFPPSPLSFTASVAVHSTTHAITSIRRHVRNVVLSHFLQNHVSPSTIPDLAGTYLFIPARLYHRLADILRDAARMPKYGIENARSGYTFRALNRTLPLNRTENSPYFELC